MTIDTCPHCNASDPPLLDDVVNGDTVCTACGYVVDYIAQLCTQLPYEYGDHVQPVVDHSSLSSDGKRTQSVRKQSHPVYTVDHTHTLDECQSQMDGGDFDVPDTVDLYGSLFKQLSQLTPEIDRHSRIVLQRACMKAVEEFPELGFKKPGNLALAIYVLFFKPAGRLRGPKALQGDDVFSRMCDLLSTRVSGVMPIIRLLENGHRYEVPAKLLALRK